MNGWNFFVIAISSLLLIYLVYKEYKRANRSARTWRMIASFSAVISLGIAALPITINKTVQKGNAIILTNGFSQDSVKRFLSDKRKSYRLFAVGTNQTLQDSIPFQINDASTLKDSLENYNEIHLFGHGLNRELLRQLQNTSLKFHPSALPEGIISSAWKNKINPGEQFIIQGKTFIKSPVKARIVLSRSSAVLDSIFIDSTHSTFSLQAIPKHLGPGLYSISVIKENDTIESYEIPVEVLPVQTVSVLMLSSAPDFETRFLKDWLTENGYALSIRTTISKNKFDYQFLNTKRTRLDRILPNTLANFDLVIADAAALHSLDRSGLQAIRSGVENGSNGLIVRSDEKKNPQAFFSSPFVLTKAGMNEKILRARLLSPIVSMPGIVVEESIFIRPSSNVKPLLQDESSSIIAASTLFGSGKMVYSVLNNTYTWSLSGYRNDYFRYWSTLINAALPASENIIQYSFSPTYPIVNQPTSITATIPSTAIPQLFIDGARIPFHQDPLLTNEWQAYWWPREKGWHNFKTSSPDTTQWVYSFDEKSRITESASRKHFATNNFLSGKEKIFNMPLNTEVVIKRSLPVIYLFMLFLLSAGYLWFEKKLSGEV